jgi:hypothetical protein
MIAMIEWENIYNGKKGTCSKEHFANFQREHRLSAQKYKIIREFEGDGEIQEKPKGKAKKLPDNVIFDEPEKVVEVETKEANEDEHGN